MKYKKSQIGWWVIISFVSVSVILVASSIAQLGNNQPLFFLLLILSLVLAVICLLFYKLTVELIGSTITLTYGIGLIRLRFKIDELKGAEVIKTPWYYGFGIRITPKGMLYNIQGLSALNIQYSTNGKRNSVMIGTPEPEQLKRALEDNWKK